MPPTSSSGPILETSLLQQFDANNDRKNKDANGDNESDTMSFTGTHYSESIDDSASSHGGASLQRPAYIDPIVAEKEQRQVFWSRVTVIVVLLISASAMAGTMFWVIWRGEHDTFEAQFENYASEISSVVQQHAENTIQVVEAFSATVSSFAEATDTEWPNIFVPDFPGRATRLAELCNAKSVTIAPIVTKEQTDSWTEYSYSKTPQLYQDAIDFDQLDTTVETFINATVAPVIWTFADGGLLIMDGDGPWVPTWQTQPIQSLGFPFTNFDLISDSRLNAAFWNTKATGLPTLDFALAPEGDLTTDDWVNVMDSQLLQPIFETMNQDGIVRPEDKMVGILLLKLDWRAYFDYLLPEDVEGITLVLSSTCSDDQYSYEINGWEAVPLGEGDLHDPAYDKYVVTAPFVNFNYENTKLSFDDVCVTELLISLYPTKEFEETFYTRGAIWYALGVVAIFVFTSLIFSIYDGSVRRRQDIVMARVIRQDKIVSNMFPSAIRDRLYGNGGNEKDQDGFTLDGASQGENQEIFGGAPMAELYPSVSVIFLDIVGFTAWSSAREPAQVFQLLESIYNAFDKLAYRHNIFKVETVGDCYVAACGLPDPRDDHAVQVAKFARDCLHKMTELTNRLEVRLGPDTGDLKLRVGIHSGQVTAGVLRGERSRYQLFGDTMNTAARMESTSEKSHIQVSSATAEELTKWKRGKWIKPRDGTVSVKGKGDMQTYWLETKEESRKRAKLGKAERHRKPQEQIEMAPLTEDDEDEEETFRDDEDDLDDLSDDGRHANMTKTERLVEWNVEVLKKLLQQILAARGDQKPTKKTIQKLAKVEEELKGGEEAGITNVLDEFEEIITMPVIDATDLQNRQNPDLIEIPDTVVAQLRDLVTDIASMYRENPFHNFEHASHVTSSVRKLLSRIVKADHQSSMSSPTSTTDELLLQGGSLHGNAPQLVDLAGHSYGITSDPLTQFSVVFSAVIHDADHPGVPNTTLVQEDTRLAQIYKKSIAEQNSVDLVWGLLMSNKYDDLRACIYSNEEELRRFRQLVVNTVMATDIVDKELQTLRKERWATAFSDDRDDSSPALDMNRKATIVIEHLIQASDVSHTMQHWHIYKQWNERFFFELYGAYKAGRAATDPSIGWYKGEIGFFDFYIIPLAKKLESCGVFGVSSDEYLSYAKANREEWVREGEKIVAEYVKKFNAAS